MDSEYLKATVGAALAQGLTEASLVMPSDPIEFLGNWLLKYADDVERREREEEEAETLAAEKDLAARRMESVANQKERETARKAKRAAEADAKYLEERAVAARQVLADYEAAKIEQEKDLAKRKVVMPPPVRPDGRGYRSDEEDLDRDGDGGRGDEPLDAIAELSDDGGEAEDLVPRERPMSDLEKAEERVATVNMALAGVDPGMVVEFATFTPETHGPVVQVLRGVLYALGHSRSTAEDWPTTAELFASQPARVIRRMIRLHKREMTARRLARVQKATRGLDVNAVKASSFAAFLFYEWLDLKVDARNEFLSARLARGRDDVIEGDEQEVFAVAEAGALESIFTDEDTVSRDGRDSDDLDSYSDVSSDRPEHSPSLASRSYESSAAI